MKRGTNQQFDEGERHFAFELRNKGGFHDFEELHSDTGSWLSRQVNWLTRLAGWQIWQMGNDGQGRVLNELAWKSAFNITSPE